jgi:dihydroxyacid dehydratase/phosphogluconate dehydratase
MAADSDLLIDFDFFHQIVQKVPTLTRLRPSQKFIEKFKINFFSNFLRN